MKLLIVESPNKAKKIQSYLGREWIVKGSGGHIRDLPDKEMGVQAPDYRPKYVVSSGSHNTVKQLKELAKKAEEVVLATDLDREGEGIAWHIKEELKLKNPDRIVFNEVTKKALENALSKRQKIDMKLVAAQETRRVLDRLIGFSVSGEISRYSNSGQRLSAGRVQSVALRIVVDREREIENFQSIDYFEVKAHFHHEGIDWFAEWDYKPLANFLNVDDSHWYDQKTATMLAEAINVKPKFQVQKIEKKETRRKAPAPFTTSTLQQSASSMLSISPGDCMKAAQKLFEEGLITYHRTDSVTLCDEAINDVRTVISKMEVSEGKSGLLPATPNTWKAKAQAQEAHEAIRPTDVSMASVSKLSGNEAKLYQLIYERTIKSQMSDAVYDNTIISMASQVKLHEKNQPFIAKARIMTFAGWLGFGKEDDDDDKPEEGVLTALPDLQKGAVIDASKGELITKKTSPPKRYTEASLIKKMETEGVGRPSTYASIMETIKRRQYVTIKGKVLIPEALGKEVRDILVNSGFSFVELNYTRGLEGVLDKIAKGEAKYLGVVQKVDGTLQDDIAKMRLALRDTVGFSCPKCEDGRLIRRQKKDKSAFYWRCDDAEHCGVFFNDKPVAEGQDPEPDLRPRPENEVIKSEITCPKCQSGVFVLRRTKKDNKVFWACSGFPKCKHSVPGTVMGPDISKIEEPA